MSPPEIERVAKGLTDFARMGLRNTHETRLMGGFFALAWTDPDLVERVGVNHPVFGSHYRLTDAGLAVRRYLQEQQ